MSCPPTDNRAADLRDALARALDLALADGHPPVETVVGPTYKPEDLYDGPRMPVWIAGGEWMTAQGPEWDTVVIAVGVVGLTFDAEAYSITDEALRLQEVETADKYGAQLYRTRNLFTPKLNPDLAILADHRFQEVSRPQWIDPALYRENGIWLSAVYLEYLDQLDDESMV